MACFASYLRPKLKCLPKFLLTNFLAKKTQHKQDLNVIPEIMGVLVFTDIDTYSVYNEY